MKKSIALVLAMITAVSCILAACSGKNADEEETKVGLEAANNEYGYETSEVTNENGDKVTTEVAVEYGKDKKGNKIAYVLDNDSKRVTDKNGKEVTIKPSTPKKSSNKDRTTKSKEEMTTDSPINEVAKTTAKDPVAETSPTTATTKTNEPDTTGEDGDQVKFSAEDITIIQDMLSVPYAYNYSYDFGKEIPTGLARHVAVYMASKESFNSNVYKNGTVALNLFKYFAQTVVGFKNKCNNTSSDDNNGLTAGPITYDSKTDTFTIYEFEKATHSISITSVKKIEGNGNYFRVFADVSGVKGVSKLEAVIQKNKLDSRFGFSVKSLKWS